MRSDRDKRTDTEREIDDFLSRFETPADELSTDINSYLYEQIPESAEKTAPAQTFSWKNVETPDLGQTLSTKRAASSPVVENKSPKHAAPETKSHKAAAVSPSAAAAKPAAKVPVYKAPAQTVPETKAPEKATVQAAVPEKTAHEKAVSNESIPETTAPEKAIPEESVPQKAAPEEIATKETIAKYVTEDSAASDEDISAEKSEDKPADKPKSKSAAKKNKNSNKKKKGKRKKGEKRTLLQFLFCKENKNYDPSKPKLYKKKGKVYSNKRYKFSFLKLIRDFVFIGAVCVLAGVIYAASIISMAPKYDYTDIYSAIDTSSIVYDDQGKQIDNVFYTENRKVVKYKNMPEDLINAFVAIEDKTFWKHHGFNWTRMVGAVLSSLTGSGRISGTSTITQQLARNVYLADTKSVRSIKRKLLEMYYASRLEHSLSKEQIIEAYLNTIYLGHGCYGVNAAARTYFSKSVKKLSLVQCAALAALPQSPDTYALLKLSSEAEDVVDPQVVATDPDTIVTNDLSRERRQLALDLMLSQGMIDNDEYDKAYDLTLNDFIKPNLKSNSSIYSYFHEYLVDTIIADLMEQYGMEYEDAERTVYTKGLKIYSTVDSTATEVIAKEFQDGSNFPYVSAPLDADDNMLNNDGQIALYRYANYFDENGNFRLSGSDGDVKVGKDGGFTIKKNHKLHIYETEVNGETDYSLEFKNYYVYDDDDILYSIAGGYLNIPAAYKSADSKGNIVIDKAYFEDPYYEGCIEIDGNDVILTPKSYTLSPRQRQPQAAMTIVGVGTGEVKAMVGGRQFGGQKVLNRSLNPRQPGSSIKPLAVYGAALQKSYELAEDGKKWKFTDFKIDSQGTKGWGDYITTHSSVEDERTKIEGKYWPNNFNNSFSGKNTFITAIQKSINTCAVKIVLQVGSDYSIEQLKRFGLTTVQDDLDNPVNDANPAALGLGAMTQGVEPLEMALAYAAFPGGGKVNTPVCYTKVLDRNGEVLLESESKQSEALNEGVAWIMQEVLKSVVDYNNYMYVTDVEPGGKTGTTNDQYDIWFDGFTPTYAASIWIGTDENVEMSSMSTPAAALWGKIINQLPNAKNGEYPSQPSNVIQTSGNYFTKGTETGLSSWSSKEAAKKARQAAYQKWLKERANHKKTVPAEYEYVDDKSKPIYEEVTRNVDDKSKPIYGDPPVIGYEQITITETDPETGEVTETVVEDKSKPIYGDPPVIGYEQKQKTEKVVVGYKQKKVKVKDETVEYEKGWRDGDFKYNGN